MDESHRTLVAALSLGLAMLAIGGQRILFPNLSVALRLSVAAVTIVLSSAGAFLASDSEIGALCLVTTPTLMGLLQLAAQPSLIAGLCRALASLHRPGVQSVTQVIGGIVLALGGVGWFEWDSEAECEKQDLEMRKVAGPAKPPLHESGHGQTDAGRAIEFMAPEEEESQSPDSTLNWAGAEQFFDKVIRTGADSEACNCFGWVFTGGRAWLSPKDVEWILEDNDYQPVSEPQPGDVAIYREHEKIIHAAIVRADDPAIGVIVEGKWGRRGVFLHQADQSGYGTQYTFYRSTRPGHVIREMSVEAAQENK
jgi:hypothetical protein